MFTDESLRSRPLDQKAPSPVPSRKDEALSGWEVSDLSRLTWPQTEYTYSPTSPSSQALFSPYLPGVSYPLENDIQPVVSENAFSTPDHGHLSFLDPTSNFTWPSGDASTFITPYLEPSQLPKYEPNDNITEDPEQLHPSRSPLRTEENKTPYTPLWRAAKTKGEPARRTLKRCKTASNSKTQRTKSSRPSTSSSESDSSSGSRSRGRKNHNLIEKKYRNRLNGQFDSLLSTLPSTHDINGVQNRSDQDRKVSKAEVLIMAKEHIASLEERRTAFERQRKTLVNNIQDLKSAWANSGGEKMP